MPYADLEELRQHRELLEQQFREEKGVQRRMPEIVHAPSYRGAGHGRFAFGVDPRKRYTTNIWGDFHRELDEGISDVDDFVERYTRRLMAVGRSPDYARRQVINRIKAYQEDTGYRYF